MTTFFEFAMGVFLLSGSACLISLIVFMWREMR